MVRIKTAPYGEIDIDDKYMIDFVYGLPGFEDYHRFALVPMEGTAYFLFLQSLDDTSICFTIADPEYFFPDYQPDISPVDIEALKTEADDDLLAYVILTIPKDFKKTTANLLSPIIINPRNHMGMQIVPVKSQYTTRHYLFPQNEKQQTKLAGE